MNLYDHKAKLIADGSDAPQPRKHALAANSSRYPLAQSGCRESQNGNLIADSRVLLHLLAHVEPGEPVPNELLVVAAQLVDFLFTLATD